jgi:hypothetical protein
MPKRPNDDGQAIEDDYKSPYPKFDHWPMTVDYKVTEIKPHTDYDGNPSRAVVGVLLKPLDDREVGETVIVNASSNPEASPKKLNRLLNKGLDQGRIKVGERLVIKHSRMIGQMKDFEVIPGGSIDLSQFPGTPRDDKTPPPF